jgi:hypothetical protein
MTHRFTWRCISAALLLIALAVGAAPGVVRGQDDRTPPLPLDEYRAAVQEASARLQADPDDLAGARRRLGAVEEVDLLSGETMPIVPLLGAADADLDASAAQLRLQTVATQLDAAPADQSAARLAVLDKVLAGAAFQQQESLLDRLRRWLANLFAQWASAPQESGASSLVGESAAQVAGWSILVVGAGILLFLLTRWLQTVLRAFVGDAVATKEGEGDLPVTPAAARAAAGRFAQGGDYRGAVRQLYLAALLTLQDRRVVVRDPSLTNREVLARTPAAHPVHAPLAEVVTIFDDVWYGVHEPDRATFEHYHATVDELERRAATPAGETLESTR